MLEQMEKPTLEEACSQMGEVGWFVLERRGDHVTGVGRAWQLCLPRAGLELRSTTELCGTRTSYWEENTGLLKAIL